MYLCCIHIIKDEKDTHVNSLGVFMSFDNDSMITDLDELGLKLLSTDTVNYTEQQTVAAIIHPCLLGFPALLYYYKSQC